MSQNLVIFFSAIAAVSAAATACFAYAQYVFNKRIHREVTSKYVPFISQIDIDSVKPDRVNQTAGYYFYKIDCHCPAETTISQVLAYKKQSVKHIFKRWISVKIRFHIGRDGHFWREKNKPTTVKGDTYIFIVVKEDHFSFDSTMKFSIISNEGNVMSKPYKPKSSK